jgi:protein ImuB
VLVDGAGTRQRIRLVNGEAARLGIRPGMPLGAAHALGEVAALVRDPVAETRVLEQLCAWACQFTPLVHPVAPDGLLLEVRGSLHLFGGLDQLRATLRRGLRELGMRAFTLASAPTPLAATWLARAREGAALDGFAGLPAALSALPLEVLRLPERQVQDFSGIGVHSVGDCLRLPRDGLARRFAPGLLRDLDRALGRERDPRPAFAPPAGFASRIDLPWEIHQAQALATGMERLLHELAGTLRARCAALRELRWVLHHRDGEARAHRISLVAPSRDVTHLARLSREYFARQRLPAPVRGIGLEVAGFETDVPAETRDLFQCGRRADEPVEHWPQFVERLQARLGPRALKALAALPDARPERALRLARLGLTGPYTGAGDPEQPRRHRARPLWLTRRPLPLSVRDGRPALDEVLSLEPERERVQAGWWEGADQARDYFVARDGSGIRWWVFRELGGGRGWFLHGVFE